MNIGISGACGRMGKRIAALAIKDKDIRIHAAIEKKGSPEEGKDLGSVLGIGDLGVTVSTDLEKVCAGMDCFIEFTLPVPTLEHLDICRRNNVPMVIGTTGLDSKGEEEIKKASDTIPVVFSPNMAVGVNLFFGMVKDASRVLGRECVINIDETHHVHKKDSPSGTAKMIGRIVRETTGIEPPIDAKREGEVIGEHGIVFDGEYEKLEVRHSAKSRDVFACGALKAAGFIVGKAPGLYDMADVLGL